MSSFYLIAFLLILFFGIIFVYSYYLKEKNRELSSIERGFCPKCHQNSIELVDKRGGGCSPQLLSFECNNCGYYNSFSVDRGCSL